MNLTPYCAGQFLCILAAADGSVTADEWNELKRFFETSGLTEEQIEEFYQEAQEVSAIMRWKPELETLKKKALKIHLEKASDGMNGVSLTELLWNLLLTAYADGQMDSIESEFIQWLDHSLGGHQGVWPALNQAVQTELSLEKEEEWLSNQWMPYSEAKTRAMAIEKRRQALLNQVDVLIAEEKERDRTPKEVRNSRSAQSAHHTADSTQKAHTGPAGNHSGNVWKEGADNLMAAGQNFVNGLSSLFNQ